MIPRPQPDEYAGFFAGYVAQIPPDADIIALLRNQADTLRALVAHLPDEQASQRPAPGEWSVKEVIGHINDTERIFAYRALRIARGDSTPLPGFEQDAYVEATNFNARALANLVDEFDAQRRANVLCFEPLGEAELTRRGTASNNPVSARALLYIMAGHVAHHIYSLRTDYGVGG
jgi:uncharacterized damage-inducible protein DinB